MFSNSVAPCPPPSLIHAVYPSPLPSIPSICRSVKIDDSSREANWMGQTVRQSGSQAGRQTDRRNGMGASTSPSSSPRPSFYRE